MFRAAWKNHAAAMMASTGITMKETVKNLQDGWFGSRSSFKSESCQKSYEVMKKHLVDCWRLFEHSLVG
jgi:hypothetical protein